MNVNIFCLLLLYIWHCYITEICCTYVYFDIILLVTGFCSTCWMMLWFFVAFKSYLCISQWNETFVVMLAVIVHNYQCKLQCFVLLADVAMIVCIAHIVSHCTIVCWCLCQKFIIHTLSSAVIFISCKCSSVIYQFVNACKASMNCWKSYCMF